MGRLIGKKGEKEEGRGGEGRERRNFQHRQSPLHTVSVSVFSVCLVCQRPKKDHVKISKNNL